MKHSFLVLLAVFLVAVGAQDLDARTYGFHYHHSHAVPHAGHHAHTHGHHNHGRPVHQHGHAPHPHVHAQHQVPSHAGHQHPAMPPTPDVLQSMLQAQNIQHPSHHHPSHPSIQHPSHQHSPVPSQVAPKVKTVPVMVCRVIQVPVARPGSIDVPKGESSSSGTHMFRNITASISNVVGRVVHPVATLLQIAPGWFNRTTPGDHGPVPHHHRQHNFTVLNHTAYHPQSHHVRPHPHHQRRNFTAPNVDVVQKKHPSPGNVAPHRTCPFSRDASLPTPAASTEAPATAMPTPAVTSTVPHTVTTTGNPTTVGVPVLHSKLCGQAPPPAVPALRADPFATANELATSIDGSTSEKSTSEVPHDIINATDTILPTTPTAVSVSLPEDRAEVTASTFAAATLLAASRTPPMPTGNATAGSTYLPASDTTSSQSSVPSKTSADHTTAQSPTTVPLLKGTQTALPATRRLPTTPPSVESTSVVPQETPDAAPFGKAAFTWSPRRFA